MKESSVRFRWSDAWLLFAVGLAAKDGSATLAAVIASADAIQHAIPEKEEVDGAIVRLHRAGYIEHEAGVVHVTVSGLELLGKARDGSPRLLEQQRALEALLAEVPWSAEPAERNRPFERVYTVTDYWDGPRGGIAEFDGAPYVYRSLFRDDLDDWDSDLFELSPISAEVLARALEDWTIFLRWRAEFDAQQTSIETHPALPEDAPRHHELSSFLEHALTIDPAHRILAHGTFRVRASSNTSLRAGVLRPLEVQWVAVE